MCFVDMYVGMHVQMCGGACSCLDCGGTCVYCTYVGRCEYLNMWKCICVSYICMYGVHV